MAGKQLHFGQQEFAAGILAAAGACAESGVCVEGGVTLHTTARDGNRLRATSTHTQPQTTFWKVMDTATVATHTDTATEAMHMDIAIWASPTSSV